MWQLQVRLVIIGLNRPINNFSSFRCDPPALAGHKSVIHCMLRWDFISDSQAGFGPVLQPYQHLAEAERPQIDLPATAPTMG
jgi:hypothetical protein